jgi:hypothetical protein
MTCENYKAAIIDVLAASAAPGATLQEHLDQCPACRAAFDRELALFAAIDTSLRAKANAGIPASFLPSIRARLAQRAPQRMGTRPLVFAVAGVAIAFTVFLTVEPHHSQSKDQASLTPQIPAAISPSTDDGSWNSGPGSRFVPANVKQGRSPHHSTLLSAAASEEPEVLVPRDQEILLRRYAQQLRRRNAAILLANDADHTELAPLQVDLIEIAELDVKPLASEQR